MIPKLMINKAGTIVLFNSKTSGTLMKNGSESIKTLFQNNMNLPGTYISLIDINEFTNFTGSINLNSNNLFLIISIVIICF